MFVDLVLLGLAMAFYPVALTIFILLLASANGPRKGAAFVFGWLVTLAVVATATILATANKPPAPGTKPSIGILAAKIALGVVLVAIAERQRRRIGKPKPPKAGRGGRRASTTCPRSSPSASVPSSNPRSS